MAQATQAAATAGGPTQHTLLQDDGLDFVDAVRAAEKARIALTGPAGSGKTWTGVSIGAGLVPEGGTVCVSDGARGSAAKYAGLFAFNHSNPATFEPQSVRKALAIAADRCIDVVFFDSFTHF